MSKKSEDLVSVVIISYNAEEYILHALESVRTQTYQNIELVVSDDCSTDSTLKLVDAWLGKNKDRFFQCRVLKTEENHGVAINCNIGCKAASGKWIRLLSGDDLLPENSIELCMAYVQHHATDGVLCTRLAHFMETETGRQVTGYSPTPYVKRMLRFSPKKQYKIMLYDYVVLPSAFYSKELMEKIGYYDTRFPEIEDYAMGLKLTKKGIHLTYCDDIVGYYHRTGINSTSQTTSGLLNQTAFGIHGKLHRQDQMLVLPNIPRYHVIFYYHYYLDLFRRYLVIHVLQNKTSGYVKLINRILLALDPIALKKVLYNRFCSESK